MSRHSRAQSSDASFVIVILVGAVAWTHPAQLVHLAFMALVIMGCLLLYKLSLKSVIRPLFAKTRDIDSLDGLEFEQYVAKLLRDSGFHHVSLTEKYDFGVDIVAEKDGVRWGIQAKRYSGLVKANAVRQVVTGLKMYDCNRAMVITNSTYSAVAQRLANANGCVLVDRLGLKRLALQGCIL